MASYTESLLASGEQIVRRAHQHAFVLVAHARYAIAALIIAVVLLVLRAVSNASGTAWDALGLVTLALFVVGLVSLAWGWLRFQNEEYVITTRRIIHAEGVVNKRATDSSLEKINDAILTESLFGRMFGFGDLDVLTASESGIERLRMLRDAKSFKKAMIEAKHDLELDLSRPTMPPLRSEAAYSPEPAGVPPQAPAPVAAPVNGDGHETETSPIATAAPARPANDRTSAHDIADTLDRLGGLRDRGVITAEEFDAKKRELLDRL
jgi:Bacterial PH domain/Short C-terminal domain